MMFKINLSKKGIVFVIIFFLIVISFSPTVSSKPITLNSVLFENQENNCIVERDGGNVSFYANTSELDSSWFVVGFSSEESIYVNEILVIFSLNRTDSNSHKFWFETSHTVLTNNLGTMIPYPHSIGSFDAIWEFFLQYDLGPFKRTIDRLRMRPHVTNSDGSSWRNISLPPGDWYLICFNFPHKDGLIETSLNLSSEAEIMFFTPTEGSTSFMYENEDFYGNLVLKQAGYFTYMGSPFGLKSIMRNAIKNVDIHNDIFVGRFTSSITSLWQKTNFQYITPEGQKMEANLTFRGYFNMSWDGDFHPIFNTIFGGNGTWQFKVNQTAIAGSPIQMPQQIILFCADVKLPDTYLFENGERSYPDKKPVKPCTGIIKTISDQQSWEILYNNQKIFIGNDGTFHIEKFHSDQEYCYEDQNFARFFR